VASNKFTGTSKAAYLFYGGTLFKFWQLWQSMAWWCSWLSHSATSRKVAGSIPDGVIGFFSWHNPSGRTMYPPRTKMSTRIISWGGQRRPVRRADNLASFTCRLSRNLGVWTYWNLLDLSRPVMGLLYRFRVNIRMISKPATTADFPFQANWLLNFNSTLCIPHQWKRH
jgi:hypothetical protein